MKRIEGFSRLEAVVRYMRDVDATIAQAAQMEGASDLVNFTLPRNWNLPPVEIWPNCPIRLQDDVHTLSQMTKKDVVVEPRGENVFDFVFLPKHSKKDPSITKAHAQIQAGNAPTRPVSSIKPEESAPKHGHLKSEQTPASAPNNKIDIIGKKLLDPTMPHYTFVDALSDFFQGREAHSRPINSDQHKPWGSQRRTSPNPRTKPHFEKRGPGRYSNS